MAASNVHQCLYIVDVGCSPEILLCLNAATGEVHTKWNITDEARNLAVNQQTGNVILTCAKQIVEYDHNGQKIRVILLPEDGMDMVWQAIPVSANQYVVSQVGYVFNC